MSNAVQIRDARPEDAEAMAPLLDALGYPAEAAVIRARCAALQRDDPTARILLATVEGRVLGLATLHVTPVIHRATGIGRITALAVLPEAQGAGIGRRLVAEAERHFVSAGLRRVEVTSGPTHRMAHEFYRRLGYDDHGVRFAKPI